MSSIEGGSEKTHDSLDQESLMSGLLSGHQM